MACSPRGLSTDGTLLSLRGTSRKTELIEIHENFIRNLEASVKPRVVPHIKQPFSISLSRAYVYKFAHTSRIYRASSFVVK